MAVLKVQFDEVKTHVDKVNQFHLLSS